MHQTDAGINDAELLTQDIVPVSVADTEQTFIDAPMMAEQFAAPQTKTSKKEATLNHGYGRPTSHQLDGPRIPLGRFGKLQPRSITQNYSSTV